MSDNRHSGGGYSIQAVQIEPKENEDKNDDDEHKHRLCLLIDTVDSDMFPLQVVSLAERLQGLSERILHARVTLDKAVAVIVRIVEEYSVLFQTVMVFNAPHRLSLLIEPNNTDMLALQAELSAESLHCLSERIEDITAVCMSPVFVLVSKHQIAVAVVMIE